MKLGFEVYVTDKNGKVIDRREGESRSWLIAWLQLIYGSMRGAAVTIKCADGVNRNSARQYSCLDANGIAGDTTRGPVVGTGTTAVTLADFAMETQIAHGVGGGQLQYGARVHVYPPVLRGKELYFKIRRTFTNGSGAPINVNEFGVYAEIGDLSNEACICRDVMTIPLVVPDAGALILTYRFRTEHTLP